MTQNTNTPAPILALPDLLERLEEHRAQGHKIISTNGSFDLLHPGHMDYLMKARQLGDLLVVAINDDAWLTRNKGPERPFWGEKERAAMLANLRWVDYVTTFSEETPCAILEQIRPNIHVKAGDYTPDKMPETPVVKAVGGNVLCIPVEHPYSTSDLVAKIRTAKTDKSFKRPDYINTSK